MYPYLLLRETSRILHYSYIVSSNVNEVIRVVLNSLFFFTKRFCTHQKHWKHQKQQKHQKHKDATKQKHKTIPANKNQKCY